MSRQTCTEHCSAVSELRAFSLWDCDAGLAADRNPIGAQGTPNSSGVVVDDASYRLRTETALVELGDMRPIDSKMAASVLLGGKWPQVHWAVIALDPVPVVNFLAWKRPGDNAVFIGLDVVLGAKFPNQPDVAVTGRFTSQRLAVRRLLSSAEIAQSPLEVQLAAFRASLPLGSGVRYFDAADDADDRSIRRTSVISHEPIVFIFGECGQHFHGMGAFDAHLERINEGKNRWAARAYELKHLVGPDAGLEPYTESGTCALSYPAVDGVTIWRKPLSEWAKARGAGRAEKADSGLPQSRRGPQGAVATVDTLPPDLGQ